jgi:hypothetical protein
MALTGIVTRNITKTSQGANGATLTTTYQVLGNAEYNAAVTTGTETNTELTMVFAHANVQAVFIEWLPTNGTDTCTLKWNSSGSPAPAMSLHNEIPLEWDVNMFAQDNAAFPNPFTADVTPGVFVTTTGPGNLNISILLQN